MRITIVGLPASGKTALAKIISKKLSIPHIHIDRFWLEAGGRKGSMDTPNIERVSAHVRDETMAAIVGESWVSDGNYSQLQPEIARRADIIIFLDISLWRRLLNHAERMFERPRRHPELNIWREISFFFEVIKRT